MLLEIDFRFVLQSDELEHEKKRTDQYETEMKKLRARVEELKKKLCASEENVSDCWKDCIGIN